MPSIFSRIFSGSIPGEILFRDAYWFAILDINPVHVGHALLIPVHEGQYLADLPTAVQQALGMHLVRLSTAVKSACGAQAVNVVVNDGPEAGQEVPHAHLHIIPRFANDGKRLAMGGTRADPAALSAMAARIRPLLASA